jgi:ferrous iron transport protein A
MRTLDSLPAGSRAVIAAVHGHDDTLLRLREMGMTPETPIAVTRRALFGDPIEVQIRGTRLCLRRVHAARFAVRDIVPASEPVDGARE